MTKTKTTTTQPAYFRTARREETADKMFAAIEEIYLSHLGKSEQYSASANSKRFDIKAMLKLVAADLEIVLDAVDDVEPLGTDCLTCGCPCDGEYCSPVCYRRAVTMMQSFEPKS
jgi:hypothetical protein